MSAFSIATSRTVVKLALRMSAVVGTLLNFINQGDGIMAGRVDVWRLCLTYLVPYCVATYSATSVTLQTRARSGVEPSRIALPVE